MATVNLYIAMIKMYYRLIQLFKLDYLEPHNNAGICIHK